MPERRANLGCGPDVREDWVNVDRTAFAGLTIRADLARVPFPFKDSVFDSLEARHLLEHLPDVVQAIEEFYRICKPDATLYIEVPFWNSDDAHTDPTHVHFFGERSFDYFAGDRMLSRFNYYSRARFRVERIDYKLNESRYLAWIPIKFRIKLARYVGNLVTAVGFHLRAIKE